MTPFPSRQSGLYRLTRSPATLLFSLAIAAGLTLPVTDHAAAQDQRPVGKESPGDKPLPGVELGTIHVEGTAPAAPRGTRSMHTTADSTGFSETVSTEEGWRGVETVPELLERSVGVQVRSLGGRDDFSTISVRGSRASQVRILLDGVSLTRASNPSVNLADLPLDGLERVEVFRGFAPVGLAASGAAGVINMVSRDPEEAELGGSISVGSFDLLKLSTHAAMPVGPGSLWLNLTGNSNDGDFTFRSNNATPANPHDDRDERRRNNAKDLLDAAIRYRMALAGGSVTLRNSYFAKKEGVPGQAPFIDEDARLKTRRDIASAAWRSSSDLFGAQADFTWLDQQASDQGPGANSATLRSTTRAGRVAADAARPLGDYHFLEGSAEVSREVFDRGGTDGDERARRVHAAVAAGDEISLGDTGAALAMQVRFEHLRSRDDVSGAVSRSSTNPRAGLRWDAGFGLTLLANASTYFRPPSLFELFGDGAFQRASPELRPESGDSYDAGLRWRREFPEHDVSLETEYVWFANEVDDAIVLVLDPTRRAKARNEERARVRGHELRLETRLPHGFSVSANWTEQRARNLSSRREVRGKRLSGQPDSEGYLRLGLDRPRWRLAWETAHRSASFADSLNFERVPRRTQHDASLGLGPFGAGPLSGWELQLQLNNVTDRQGGDELQFPLPGRAWYVTLSYSDAG